MGKILREHRSKEKHEEILIEIMSSSTMEYINTGFINDEFQHDRGAKFLSEIRKKEIVEQIIDNFIEIHPPYVEYPDNLSEKPSDKVCQALTYKDDFLGGAISLKPGNILLDFRKLVTVIAGGTLAIIGNFHSPWLIMLVVIVVWDKFFSLATVNLSEVHASIIWSMWMHSCKDLTIAKSDVAKITNDERKKYNRHSLEDPEIEDALKDLQRMRCIKEHPKDSSLWLLKEKVIIKYT